MAEVLDQPRQAWQVRELPAEEYPRLSTLSGPLAGIFTSGHLPSPDSTRFIIAEHAGQIVAYWPIFNAVHMEPLWIDPAHRGDGVIGRALIEGAVEALKGAHVGYAFAIIGDQDQPANGQMAERLGFDKVPGTLYGLDLSEVL